MFDSDLLMQELSSIYNLNDLRRHIISRERRVKDLGINNPNSVYAEKNMLHIHCFIKYLN